MKFLDLSDITHYNIIITPKRLWFTVILEQPKMPKTPFYKVVTMLNYIKGTICKNQCILSSVG